MSLIQSGSPSPSSKPVNPYTGPVRFTITCYGYSYTAGPDPELAPGSYTPEPMYSLSGACAGAGCTVDEDMYLNYRHLDSCDLAGDASGVRFLVKNYAPTPIDFSTCDSPAGSDHRSPCELRIAIPEDVALPAAPQGVAGPTGRSYTADFLIALVVTLLVELPILWVLARGVFKLTAFDATGARSGRAGVAAHLASAVVCAAGFSEPTGRCHARRDAGCVSGGAAVVALAAGAATRRSGAVLRGEPGVVRRRAAGVLSSLSARVPGAAEPGWLGEERPDRAAGEPPEES